MNYLLISIFVVAKVFMSYALFNMAIYQKYTVDYAIACSLIFFFVLVLTKISNNIASHVTAMVAGTVAAWSFTSFASMFPYSGFYFWVFGYDNVFLFTCY